jgi:hypothetical protein
MASQQFYKNTMTRFKTMKLKHAKTLLPAILLFTCGFAQATPTATNSLTSLWQLLFPASSPLVCPKYPTCYDSPLAPEQPPEQPAEQKG